MPRSKTGRKRPGPSAETLTSAMNYVLALPSKKVSLREASKTYNVKLTTLQRHLKKFKFSGMEKFNYKPNYDVNKGFTRNEE